MPKEKTALITGATSGMGYEFANEYARLKYNLIAIGRNEDKLRKLKSELESKYRVRVDTIKIDLSDTNEVLKFSEYIDLENTEIDILINNAGTGVLGEFNETDFRKELSMININVIALTYITKIVLKKMLIRGSGKILNVASSAAFKPGPLMAVYYATKSYVLSFSRAVAFEIKGSGVSITVLCPGPVNTKFLQESCDSELQFIKYDKMSNPEDVAKTGISALEKNKDVEIPGFRNKLNALAVKFIPAKTLMSIIYRSKKKFKSENK